jgi:hypothetical protein
MKASTLPLATFLLAQQASAHCMPETSLFTHDALYLQVQMSSTGS